MKRLFVCVLMVVVTGTLWAGTDFWYPISGPQADRILVPGEPPLTVGLQNGFLNCLEFGLALALTQQEQEAARAALMAEYLANRSELLEALREIGGIWMKVEKARPEERGSLRRIIRDSLLEETQKSPQLGMAQVVRQILKNGNEAVLVGPPRLDRRLLAAFFELVQMCLRLRDRRVVVWDDQTRAALEARLLQRVPQLSPEGRVWLGNADFHRAMIAANWQRVPADEKEVIRKFLIETFAPTGPGEIAGVDLDRIPLPPPTIFPLPTDLPWDLRQ